MWRLLIPLALGCNDPNKGGQDDTGGVGGDDTAQPSYDEGCITVDGQGGYAWINDAIAVADEGSEIVLCAEDAHEEAVVVDKAVTITGPGPASFVLVAPSNQVALTVTASGATVTGVAISTTRGGVEVTQASDVTLGDLQVMGAGTWGIKAKDSTGLLIDGCTVDGNAYGGVGVDGGDATIRGSTLAENTAYGVWVGGADVTVESSTVSGTTYTDEDDLSDGIGVYAEDYGSLTVVDSTLSGNFLANALVDSADLDVAGGEVTDSIYGIAAFTGTFSLSDVTIADNQYVGAWLASPDTVDVDNVHISVDPEASYSAAFDEWGGDYGLAGTGLIAVAPEATISGSTIEGYNNCGLLLAPYDAEATATVSDTTIDNTGRYGLYADSVVATLDNVDISGVRDPDDVDDTDCTYVNYIAGVYGVYADITVQGGSVTDSEGWGVAGVYAVLAADGAEFTGGECAGIVGYESTLSATGNTFRQAPPYGSIYTLYSPSDYISGNTFTDSQFSGDQVDEYDYWDDYGYRFSYTWHDRPQLVDIVSFLASSVVIDGNTFSGGDTSVQLYGVDATITDNTWSDYRADILDVSYYNDGSTDPVRSDIVMTDNTIDDFDGYGISCSNSDIELKRTSFTHAGTLSYSYDYVWEDSSGTSTYTSTVASAYSALYGNGCSVVAEDLDMTDLDGSALYLYSYSYGGSYELSDVRIARTGLSSYAYNPTIYAYGYYEDTSIDLYDVSIEDAGYGAAIELYPYAGSESYDATMSLSAEGLSIDGAQTYGLQLQGERVTAELVDSTITGTGSHAIYASGATLDADSLSLSGAVGSGVYLSGTTGTFTGSTSTTNSEYGMQCVDAEITDCSGNDLAGNTLGEQTGCDASCGTEASAE